MDMIFPGRPELSGAASQKSCDCGLWMAGHTPPPTCLTAVSTSPLPVGLATPAILYRSSSHVLRQPPISSNLGSLTSLTR